MLTRRRLLTGTLGAMAASGRARAQPSGRVWRVGFISVAPMQIERVFFDHLRKLGYVEERNMVVDRRYSEGRAERFRDFAAALAKANLDLIIATTTPAALEIKKVTSTIPVVLPNSIDPVGVGLVASLAHPGGNITGTTQQAPDLIAKRLQLLIQAIPRVSTVAVIWNAANPANGRVWGELQEAARGLRIALQSREVRGPVDFDRVLADLARERPDALFLVGDRLTLQHGQQIVESATQHRVPTMLDRAYPETSGALLSYGADEEELWRRAAELAARILHGAKPADLPFEQPTKFKFVVNARTARVLGLSVPPSVLARADQVIE